MNWAAQGQSVPIRRMVWRAWWRIRAGVAKSRNLSFFGSARFRSPSRARCRSQAVSMTAIPASWSQAVLRSGSTEGSFEAPRALSSLMLSSTWAWVRCRASSHWICPVGVLAWMSHGGCASVWVGLLGLGEGRRVPVWAWWSAPMLGVGAGSTIGRLSFLMVVTGAPG